MNHLPSSVAQLIAAISLFLLSNIALASPQHIFHLTNGLNSAEVPFRLVNDLIVVDVVLAGKKHLNFILDNGTSNPVIFQPDYLQGLNLNKGSKIIFRGAGTGNAVKATVITGTSLHLSGVATDRLGMVVLDRNPFDGLRFEKTKVHGVLGSTLFRSFITEIDYPNKIIRFHRHDSFICPPNFQSIPMKVVNGKPYVEAWVSGDNAELKANLMIDLGFNNSLMLQLPDSMTNRLIAKYRISRIGVGYSGVLKGKSGRVASMQIGSRCIEEVIAIAPFSRSFPEQPIDSELARAGSIGNTLFQNTSIILNYPDETFYFPETKAYIADHPTKDAPVDEIESIGEDSILF